MVQTTAVSATALLRGPAKNATDLSQGVYDAASATPRAAALVSHGVTTAKLKALQDAIKKFAAPRPGRARRSRAASRRRNDWSWSSARRNGV